MVVQKFFAAGLASVMDRKSCARIGACVPTAPAQTSASSIPSLVQNPTKRSTKASSPMRARACKGARRAMHVPHEMVASTSPIKSSTKLA